jgi:hypothetical protein
MKPLKLFLIVCLISITNLTGQAAPKEAARQIKNPKLVAQKLYQAWHLKARRAALKVAAKEAVEKLFGVRWRRMRFEGCKQREEGGFECVYRDERNDLSMAMIVDGGASAGGYNVASVSFSTEE